jgi:hypothetical protein
MAHFLTPITARLLGFARSLESPLFRRAGLRLALRLDRVSPDAHLIWDITNATNSPLSIARLTITDRTGTDTAAPSEFPRTIGPGETITVATAVDWALLSARSVAAVDEQGRAYEARSGELARIQRRLRELIDRRAYQLSAQDWLFGATNLAFGAVILGLGFFMLMWVIATG